MWQAVSMVVVLPISGWGYFKLTIRPWITKHLADTKNLDWRARPAKRMRWRRRKKMRAIVRIRNPTRFIHRRTNATTTLGFGLGTNRFERRIQRCKCVWKDWQRKTNFNVFPKLVFTLKQWRNLEGNDPEASAWKTVALECATKNAHANSERVELWPNRSFDL